MLADAEGLAAVTMRRLATELGVGAMTLYTHVPGKGELVDLMYDAVLGEVYAAPPAGDWRERLTAVARENWDLFSVTRGRRTSAPGGRSSARTSCASTTWNSVRSTASACPRWTWSWWSPSSAPSSAAASSASTTRTPPNGAAG